MLCKIFQSENLITFICTLSLLGMMFPYRMPIYGIVCLITFFMILIKKRGVINARINLGIILFAILIGFYLWGVFWTFFTTGIIFKTITGDILNILSLSLIFPLINELTYNQYRNFTALFQKTAFISAIVISIIGLYKFYMLFNGVLIEFFFAASGKYPPGTSLMSDYNYFALGNIVGLISGLYIYTRSKHIFSKFLISTSLIIIFINIILASSRRAWVVLTIISLLLVIKIIKIVVKLFLFFISGNMKNVNFNKIISITLIILFIIFMINITNTYIDFDNRNFFKLTERFISITDEQSTYGRTDRWKYACELFDDYTFFQTILGNGFIYLRHYAQNIASGDTAEDYPHNFVLSALLYSGAIGTSFMIIYLFYILYLLIKSRYHFTPFMGYLFIISLLFDSISGNSMFNNKVTLLLMIIIINNFSSTRFIDKTKEKNGVLFDA